ncbi:hypothetical protein IUS38_09170 [Mycobacteroides abscessus subsp. abscessus]|uniref:hypothetical protein n=1 Tax=Mycobacteroides abscessus TaxID=36809 RepID=UPI0019D29C29|nr:hypothetical protein [Mycobacteroides abscessus]MBN7435737.1 hypothetical protein [Mycobacteroides abscessus subsp. abscessus]
MKRVVTLFGDIHPVGGAWFLDHPLTATAADGTKIRISISNGAFAMQITTEGPDDTDAAFEDGSFQTWVNEVIYGHTPTLRCVLDAMGLHLGAVLDPEMKGGVVEGVAVLGSMARLAHYGTEDQDRVSAETLGRTTRTGLRNPFARSALADVRNALRFDSDSPFFCYRAVDSLRQHYAATTEAQSERASWEKLRADLDIEKADIMALKAFADSRRHGGAGTSLHADHLKWTQWTRQAISRFITKHGSEEAESAR